jgi:hypothetical protein
MLIHILNNQELTELEDELPKFINDIVDIQMAITQAEMNPGDIFKLNTNVPQIWHLTVRFAASHNKLPLLLGRVNAQLGDRQDADALRRLIALAVQRKASVVLAEEAQELRSQGERLLSEPDAGVAVHAALDHIRPSLCRILEKLDDERFWPTIFVGATDEGAQAARNLLYDKCLDALRAVDVLIKRNRLAAATPSSDADDRDRLRLEKAHGDALLDAKYAMMKALRGLHQELVRRLPVPTGDTR